MIHGTQRMLVIGGTSPKGIGAAIAKAAEPMYDVDTPEPVEMDVTSDAQILDYLATHGPYSHVVYSAGIASLQWIDDLIPVDQGERPEMMDVYNVNVLGFLRVLWGLSKTQSGGRILAIVSDAATTPMRGSIAYCTSKAALSMAVRCAAREMGPTWSVNGLSPSAVEGTRMSDWIDTEVPVFRGWEPEQARQYELSSIPKGRRVTPTEVADVALSTLTGPDFMTGSIITLTGGK
jgi:3-oxoacyl-[acyl-carrier protein] reductase